ncbi:hypothetical protein SAMN05421770_103183 [Granulicella rosea]|uniref:Uncharacterized protein n=2 Tax=Granulicella rosea TaxID=474952 RepID=A0A239IMV5_9BACT|nr:hypothetical protein SAMN05421770_103183 [Granulicella rosea]
MPQSSSQSDAQKPQPGEQVLTEDGKVVVAKPMPGPVAGDAIFAPLATGGPDTLHRKTMSYVYVAFGPRALITPAIGAAFRQAFPNNNYPPEWRRGIGAFGRNYGSDVGTKTTILTTRYAVGALTHEDFRYRPTWIAAMGETMRKNAEQRAVEGNDTPRPGHTGGRNDIMLQLPKSDKSVAHRLFYAIGYTFVDRSDDGHYRLALANISSAAAGGFVANAYLPDGFNDVSHGARRMGSRFGSYAFQNVTREFSPEIVRGFHALHLPTPGLHLPEWWTKTSGPAPKQ